MCLHRSPGTPISRDLSFSLTYLARKSNHSWAQTGQQQVVTAIKRASNHLQGTLLQLRPLSEVATKPLQGSQLPENRLLSGTIHARTWLYLLPILRSVAAVQAK